ncbi:MULTISPECIES: selenide, water dikinase SelD [unclassified Saccharopolyspora]|uniref:selenide, water dikinase SelD n=1 Tax=unclassified Saccharopolyspora TaxID=2646250 RepID=UPI001CD67724|nr:MULTISPECIES: selenide, water dikinase SelD [unclassified Saccharopolyspora]MCA1186721.1 selenide, water dikinase SelD [Saccharopolyspora sp. 6T]MCA1194592.1 selenide, water dikinase SelD [Saccharopolyspora sp. 6V]MCA1226617.1 selenide, water dikinase SelD [Saccharopolyspora sp. 6M]MCA1278338.1 selenide, water dikinase SelD [Saccharopolyspora sp. 7B]
MTTVTTPLTQYSPGGGCACKMPQSLLNDVLASLNAGDCAGSGRASPAGAALRVGLSPADDAAVFDVPGLEGRSLVVTTDFLTPMVDDPYDWGRIAATNALSDVYAMGGRPLLALNLLAWPENLDRALLAEVLRGGAGAVAEAGAVLAGGHSIVDPAPKYGLAVVGEVDENSILRKGGGHAGDLLVLTKRLGAGVIGTAVKRGQAPDAAVSQAVATMSRSNASAAGVATTAGLRGGTDVTGYGLIGHLHEMALAAGLEARIRPETVPLLPSVAELVRQGCAPDGSRRTLTDALAAGWFDPATADETTQLLLADAQTSGGLLLCVPPAAASSTIAALHGRGDAEAAVVGELVAGRHGHVAIETQPGTGGGECRWTV